MSNVLYVGNAHTAAWICPMIEAHGGYLYTSNTLYETLAIAVNYAPDLVILDAGLLPEIADEAKMHLLTIGVEPIVVYDEVQLVDALQEKMTPLTKRAA